jgi:hypothetical protein
MGNPMPTVVITTCCRATRSDVVATRRGQRITNTVTFTVERWQRAVMTYTTSPTTVGANHEQHDHTSATLCW